MIGAIARLVGADPVQCGLLLRTSLITDFRAASPSGGRRARPLVAMLVTYGLVGGLLGFLASRRGDDLGFAVLMNVVSMVNVALTVLMDFNSAILNPSDLDIVGPRPVTARTYLAARLLNFFFYVGLLALSLNVLPAAIGGSRYGAGYGASFLASSVGGCFFAASLIVAVYSVFIRWLDLERAKDAFLYVHVVLTLSLIVVYQWVGRTDEWLSPAGGWEVIFPPLWFAAAATLATREAGATQWLLTSAAAGSTLLLLLAPVRMMSLRYSEYLGSLSFTRRILRPPRPAPSSFWRRILPGHQFAFFELLRVQIGRDRTLKMRALPMFLFPLFFLAWGYLDDRLQNPFALEDPQRAIYAVFVPYFILLAGVNLLFVVQTSDQHKASWIFYVHPIARPDQAALGMVKFVLYGLALPLMAVFAAAMALLWRSVPLALFHAALSWLQIDAALSLAAMLLIRDFPFSRPMTRGESFKFLLIHVGMIVVFGAAAASQILSYHWVWAPVGLCGALLVLSIVLRAVSSRVVGARLRRPRDCPY